jgi:hypothetical protein
MNYRGGAVRNTLAERAAAHARRAARIPPVIHRREFAAIDVGMAAFIMEQMGVAFEDVPKALQEWLSRYAKGSGAIK